MSAKTPRPSTPWSPSDRDRRIFRWVRFDGMTQQWVANQLDMNQSTVSRVVERYERWIARGGPAQAGALTREERIRYQRWLNYERNEHIIASSLRLADDMQRPYDTSTSTVTNPPNDFGGHGTQIRTQHMALDRSASACRYLRLAFRVGQEQQKLVEQDELSPLDPLTESDLDPTLDQELSKPLSNSRVGCAHQPNPPPVPNPHPNLSRTLDPPSFQGSSLGTPNREAPASLALEASPDTSTTTAVEASAVEGSPDPSTTATAGLPDRAESAVSTLDLSPNHAPVHKTHNPKPTSTPSHTAPYAHEPSPQNFSPTAAYDPDADHSPFPPAKPSWDTLALIPAS